MNIVEPKATPGIGPKLLFFYGTLMSRDRRGGVLTDVARPVGEGHLSGADMYVVAQAFPAYVPGSGRIVGEVWEPLGETFAAREQCLRAALVTADAIEGYREYQPGASMYLRVRVTLDDGREVWTYRWNEGLYGLSGPVPSGSWRIWREEDEAAREPDALDYYLGADRDRQAQLVAAEDDEL